MKFESFAASRGFTADELRPYARLADGPGPCPNIIIPYRSGHGVWYERVHHPCQPGCGRCSNPKYADPKGARPHLYNPLGLGPNTDLVWMAEGEFDTLSLIVAGQPAVGIAGTGKYNKHWSLLYQGAKVLLAFDADAAGQEAATRISRTFGPATEVVMFPTGPYPDVNAWFAADRLGFIEATGRAAKGL